MQTFFSRSPWQRPSVMPPRSAFLGQTSPNCEPTAEGGQRCADGTYYPPGCKPGSGSGVPAAAPTPGASVPLIVGGVAAVAAAGYLLMAGHKHRMAAEPTALESSYPEAVSQIQKIADSINTERSNDAYYFSKYIETSKRRQDLALAEGAAQKVLAEQERLWNLYHNNPNDYQAAQAAYDQAVSNKGAAAQEMQDNRDGINRAAQNVMIYRSNAEAIISQLPQEVQAQAWRIIDPCSFRKTMEGRLLGQFSWNNAGGATGGGGLYSWNGYGSMTPEQRLLQNAQQSMNAPAEPTPEQRLLRQSQASVGADCYTCANGGDIRTGVDAATAASLKAQGYRCRKDECAQNSGGFGNYGSPINYGSQQSSAIETQGAELPAYGSGTAMLRGKRYPVVNSH